jgi:hypothetical protein
MDNRTLREDLSNKPHRNEWLLDTCGFLSTLCEEGISCENLTQLFGSDIPMLSCWLNAFSLDWTPFNCCALKLDTNETETQYVDGRPVVWDGAFCVIGGKLHYGGYEGPSGHGKYHTIEVLPIDVIQLV